MFRLMMLLLSLLLLAACEVPEFSGGAPATPPAPSTSSSSPAPSGNPYDPQPGDNLLQRGDFYLDEQGTSIIVMESFPLQFMLNLKGSLPTPCNEARIVVHPPDAANKIVVEAYTVIDPNEMCIQVIEEFEANIRLGSFPQGHYTVWVNETMIGEIDA
jgi:hypothetical protein